MRPMPFLTLTPPFSHLPCSLPLFIPPSNPFVNPPRAFLSLIVAGGFFCSKYQSFPACVLQGLIRGEWSPQRSLSWGVYSENESFSLLSLLLLPHSQHSISLSSALSLTLQDKLEENGPKASGFNFFPRIILCMHGISPSVPAELKLLWSGFSH